MTKLVRQFTRAVVTVTMLGSLSAAANAHPDAQPDRVAILAPAQGAAMLHQCSRAAPTASEFWAPSLEDVLEAERRLPTFLTQATCRVRLKPPAEYFRQYVGMTIGGRRLLYLNAVHADIVTLHSDGPHALDWHSKAIVVCDGGEAFWGVEYDLGARSFGNLQCNGYA